MHTRVYRTFNTAAYKRALLRRRKHRRAIRIGLLLLVLSYVSLSIFLVPAQAIVAHEQPATSIPASAVQLSWPTSGHAAIGAAGYGLLASNDTGIPVPTASVIKTVLALAVLEKYPLDPGESGPTLTMSRRDVGSYEWYVANHGSVLPVSVGEKFSEYQALQAALIRSANNMADTLAVWAFGSLQNYHDYATNLVGRLGLDHTTIGSDASGLNPTTTSTPTDLVKLGEIVMSKPVLAEIVNQQSVNLPGVGTVHSTNTLLGSHGIIGIKTGTDYQDKGSYLFASRYQISPAKSVTIIGAVMGADSSPAAKEQAVTLLASAKKAFAAQKIYKAGQHIGAYRPPWLSDPVLAYVKQDVDVAYWRGQALDFNVSLNDIRVPMKAGTEVGHIFVMQHGEKKVVGTIALAKDINTPSVWWRLAHPLASWRLHSS